MNFSDMTKYQKNNPLIGLKRPRCECNSEMGLRLEPDNSIYSTTWVCRKCSNEYYSKLTVEEWANRLKNEKVSELSQEIHKYEKNYGKEKCPLCEAILKFKSPCCGQEKTLVYCSICGYKEYR